MSEKKWGTCKKKERIARKVWRILEQLKWRSKDQNSKKCKKLEDTKNQTTRWWIQRSKDQIIKEVKNSEELHCGIGKKVVIF